MAEKPAEHLESGSFGEKLQRFKDAALAHATATAANYGSYAGYSKASAALSKQVLGAKAKDRKEHVAELVKIVCENPKISTDALNLLKTITEKVKSDAAERRGLRREERIGTELRNFYRRIRDSPYEQDGVLPQYQVNMSYRWSLQDIFRHLNDTTSLVEMLFDRNSSLNAEVLDLVKNRYNAKNVEEAKRLTPVLLRFSFDPLVRRVLQKNFEAIEGADVKKSIGNLFERGSFSELSEEDKKRSIPPSKVLAAIKKHYPNYYDRHLAHYETKK